MDWRERKYYTASLHHRPYVLHGWIVIEFADINFIKINKGDDYNIWNTILSYAT